MSVTTLAEVQEQIKTYWEPFFTRKLRERLLLAELVNKDYKGSIGRMGDTVKVSQVVDPQGELRTIGVDADTFGSEKVQTIYVDVKADKRAVTAHEFVDLVELQSQLQRGDVQDGMIYAINKQINDYLYSLVAPSASNPDHDVTSVSALNRQAIAEIRTLASKAEWPEALPWYGLVSPDYWEDMLTDDKLSSSDFVDDRPTVAGQRSRNILGWNMFEDNSRKTPQALFFNPDFLYYVAQTGVNMEVSNLHSNKQFGFVMSMDIVFGAKLGLEGDVKHIRVTN